MERMARSILLSLPKSVFRKIILEMFKTMKLSFNVKRKSRMRVNSNRAIKLTALEINASIADKMKFNKAGNLKLTFNYYFLRLLISQLTCNFFKKIVLTVYSYTRNMILFSHVLKMSILEYQ